MKWCRACIQPNTRPGIVLGGDGICNACNNSRRKMIEIDWGARAQAFQRVIENAMLRSNRFDCVIPVSGGKDSTWQVVKCLQSGLRPLAVTWKTPARTAIGQRNLDNLVQLGVDHVDWQVNPEVEKRFLVKAFERYGATAIPMHMAMFNIPLSIAVRLKIPLVVWGENSAFEYGSGGDDSLAGHCLDANWLRHYGVTHGTTARDWIDADLSEKELSSYFGPTDAELDHANVSAIFLGHYFAWDVATSLQVAQAHGFMSSATPRTGVYEYADIDDDFISIHHWMKWYKFGMTRSFDNLSLEIRAGRTTRSLALEIIRKNGEERPHEDISRFCAFTGISEQRFHQIAEVHRNQVIWRKHGGVWRMRNFIIPDWNWT